MAKDKKYKRGSLSKAVYLLFDRVGVDRATYDQTLKLAKSILPSTKFNHYHFSWYKNKYREINRTKRSSVKAKKKVQVKVHEKEVTVPDNIQ